MLFLYRVRITNFSMEATMHGTATDTKHTMYFFKCVTNCGETGYLPLTKSDCDSFCQLKKLKYEHLPFEFNLNDHCAGKTEITQWLMKQMENYKNNEGNPKKEIMVFNKLGPNYHVKSMQYFYVVSPSQVLQSCLPVDYPNSLDDLNRDEYVYIAPLSSLKDEHVVGPITDEELKLYVGELMENIFHAHGPNAPVWFTSIGWNKLAAQPREAMQENCVKTPMLHMTGPLGSGKSDLYHEIRTTDPQVIFGNKTQIQLDTSPSMY